MNLACEQPSNLVFDAVCRKVLGQVFCFAPDNPEVMPVLEDVPITCYATSAGTLFVAFCFMILYAVLREIY